jgi:hypothetical protein
MAELTIPTLTPTLNTYSTQGMAEVWGAAQWASGVRANQQLGTLLQTGAAVRGIIT